MRSPLMYWDIDVRLPVAQALLIAPTGYAIASHVLGYQCAIACGTSIAERTSQAPQR